MLQCGGSLQRSNQFAHPLIFYCSRSFEPKHGVKAIFLLLIRTFVHFKSTPTNAVHGGGDMLEYGGSL
jgi:hypothetical protein